MFLKQLSAALLVAGLAGVAGAAEAPAARGAKPAAAPQDDVVCTYEKSLGSHLKRRVCTTRVERDARARADQDRMRTMSGRPQNANVNANK